MQEVWWWWWLTDLGPVCQRRYGTSHMVTALFVVNELIQQSKARAMAALGALITNMRRGKSKAHSSIAPILQNGAKKS